MGLSRNVCLRCRMLLLLLLQLVVVVRYSHAAGTEQLMWNPTPDATCPGDGMKPFEGIEDDRNHTDPGVKHIFVEDDHNRVNMNMKVRDTLPNRQCNEVRGMADTCGKPVNILEGETWRLEHSLYIPSSLKATTSFTHIMQLKKPGMYRSQAPILTMSLLKNSSEPTIILRVVASSFALAATTLTPLHDSWIHSSVTFTASTDGAIHWVLTDSQNCTVVDAQGHHTPLWIADRVRPKWGIYRSLEDKANLEDCYLLLKNFGAFKLT